MKDHLAFEELRCLSWPRIEKLQNARFRATMKHLLPQVPFYHDLLADRGVKPRTLHHVEDWHVRGLPLIKKSLFRKRPQDFVVQPSRKGIFLHHLRYIAALDFTEAIATAAGAVLHPHATQETIKAFYTPKMPAFSGGTESGDPTPVLITTHQKHETLRHVIELIGKHLLASRIPKNAVGMNLFPYAPHLGWHATHEALELIADLNMCTAAGGALNTERLVRLASKAPPGIICGMADYLRNRFLPLMLEAKARLPPNVLIINGATKMHESERDGIAQLAKRLGAGDVSVLDLYAASELKEDLMPECAPGSGYHHTAPLSTILRTVHVHEANEDFIEKYAFTPPADGGAAVLWNIGGAGTLLAGYALGDAFTSIERKPCVYCKLPLERIMGVDRTRDVSAQLALTGIVEEKVKGTLINLSALRSRLLASKTIRQAQIVVRKSQTGDSLIVRIAPEKTAMPAKTAAEAILHTEEVKTQLELTTLEKLQQGALKFEGIIVERSEVNKNRGKR